MEERKHFDDPNQNFPLNTHFRPRHSRSKHSTLLPKSSRQKHASSPKGHQKRREKCNRALKLLARPNKRFLSSLKRKKASSRQWGISAGQYISAWLQSHWGGEEAFGGVRMRSLGSTSTAWPGVWIQDLNHVLRAHSNTSGRHWRRENYSSHAFDPPFYLVKMFYIFCIRGTIYPRNVINSIASKTTHKLYTAGRLKSHLLPSDFLLHVPKKSKCG